MAEALCQAGLKGIAILDVLTEYGAVAAEELYTKYEVPAQFYKVDVRNDSHVAECIESVCPPTNQS